MNESDTPRTDEAIEAMGLEAYVVPVEVCRQLELELNVFLKNQLEMQAEVEWLRRQIEKLTSIADMACNLLNLKGGYHESYELRNEIKAEIK